MACNLETTVANLVHVVKYTHSATTHINLHFNNRKSFFIQQKSEKIWIVYKPWLFVGCRQFVWERKIKMKLLFLILLVTLVVCDDFYGIQPRLTGQGTPWFRSSLRESFSPRVLFYNPRNIQKEFSDVIYAVYYLPSLLIQRLFFRDSNQQQKIWTMKTVNRFISGRYRGIENPSWDMFNHITSFSLSIAKPVLLIQSVLYLEIRCNSSTSIIARKHIILMLENWHVRSLLDGPLVLSWLLHRQLSRRLLASACHLLCLLHHSTRLAVFVEGVTIMWRTFILLRS